MSKAISFMRYIHVLTFSLCRKNDLIRKLNFKIYDVRDWTTNNYDTYIVQYLSEDIEITSLFSLHCSSEKVVEKSNKENLKVIENALPNKSGNPESLKK